MMREKLLADLQQEYAMRREENLRRYEERRQEACDHCAGLDELLTRRHAAILSGVKTSLLARQKNPAANASLPSDMARYNASIAAALKAGGYAADYLQPVYTCPDCHDEGYVYAPSRRMCACMTKELNRRVLSVLGLAEDKQTFETFDPMVFSDAVGAEGVSQRKIAMGNRDRCMAYADSFPNTDVRDLLLMGKSGLGKTYLLRAIAHRVAENGAMPLYTSAYHMFEVARQSYIENNSDLLSEMMNVPLLLLDDLGTEPMMNNITIVQLFNLLNERHLAGRHTVLSTNLTLPELRERYTERITSRFLDATSCKRLGFIGDDIRKTLKKGANKA
ncbi:MAG: ATP-binding protein [Clostridia bacterium]